MVVCAKHMRDERARNEQTYAKINQLPSSDTIVNSTNPQSFLLARSTDILVGSTNIDMNAQKITNMAPGSLANDAITKAQLDLKSNSADVYTKTQTDSLLSDKTNTATTTALDARVTTNTTDIATIQT